MVQLDLQSIAYEAKTLNLAKEGSTTFYVDGTDGLNIHDGGSWAQAFKTIQHAIDESESWAKIFIKAGTYAESLTIPQDGMSLIGERTSSVIIDPATSGNIIASSADNLFLASLTAVGDGAGPDNATIALSGNYAHLSKIEVGNRTSTGIGINPTGDHNTIDKATIYQTHPGGVGIRIGGDYSTVKNCVFNNLDYYGIYLLGAEWCRIYENTISNAGSYVFYASSFAEANTVYHNNFMGTMKDDSGGKVSYFENYYPDHITDTNNDGLSDSSRTQNGATDYQPVSRKNGWKQGSLGISTGGAGAATEAKQDIIIANQAGEETISSYDLPNDVAENTVIEITNTKRLRLGSVWLDFVNLVQDATIKIYHKIDGSTYRQYDEFSWATSEEDGVLLRDITINGDWKLTVTSTIAQGAIKAIPYNVIKTTMEA